MAPTGGRLAVRFIRSRGAPLLALPSAMVMGAGARLGIVLPEADTGCLERVSFLKAVLVAGALLWLARLGAVREILERKLHLPWRLPAA